MVILLRTDLRIRSVLKLATLSLQFGLNPKNGGTSGKQMISLKILKNIPPETIVLILLLCWNLVSPAFRARSFCAGQKQSLLTRGGVLHAFSFFASLMIFVVNNVMLGYHNIFLVLLPQAVMTIAIFVAKSYTDLHFRAWSLGPKLTHCLLASIFPITTPTSEPEAYFTTMYFTK